MLFIAFYVKNMVILDTKINVNSPTSNTLLTQVCMLNYKEWSPRDANYDINWGLFLDNKNLFQGPKNIWQDVYKS